MMLRESGPRLSSALVSARVATVALVAFAGRSASALAATETPAVAFGAGTPAAQAAKKIAAS